MAQKEQQLAGQIPPQSNPYGRVDEEVAQSRADDLRRKKIKKYVIYGVAFVIFQVIMLSIMGLTIMKFRNPKFRVRSATFDGAFDVGTAANRSFNISMNTKFGVRNNNFGPFKYQNATVDFYYRNTKVGEAFVRKSSVNIRNTKKVDVMVNLSSKNLTSKSELANDISSGILPLTSQSRIRGKVTIMFMMKKNRATNMNCTMEIAIATKQLQNLKCK